MPNTKQNESNNTLKVYFWNARSINKRKNELPDILKDLDFFYMCRIVA